MDIQEVLAKIQGLADPKAVEGMASFGIAADALRELKSEAVLERLKHRGGPGLHEH